MDIQSSAENLKLMIQRAARIAKITGGWGAFSEEALDLIRNDLPLSSDIVEWYTVAAPIELGIPWSVSEMVLYSPENLVVSQEGYRWEVGKRGEIDLYWNENWITIGDINADPIIAHVDITNTPISFALHGVGSWTPQRVAPNLAVFLDVLSAWLRVFTEYRGEIVGLDDALRPDFTTDLRDELNRVLSPQHVNNFLNFCE